MKHLFPEKLGSLPEALTRSADDADEPAQNERYGDTGNLSPTERAYLVNRFYTVDGTTVALAGEFGGFAVYEYRRIDGETIEGRPLDLTPWPRFCDLFDVSPPDDSEMSEQLHQSVEQAPERENIVMRSLELVVDGTVDDPDDPSLIGFTDLDSEDVLLEGSYATDGLQEWREYVAQPLSDLIYDDGYRVINVRGDMYGFAVYKHTHIENEIPRDSHLSLLPWPEFIEKFGQPPTQD